MGKVPFFQSLIGKVIIMVATSLLMLIPLALIRNQAKDRESHFKEAFYDVTLSWGAEQTFQGPYLRYLREIRKEKEIVKDHKTTVEIEKTYADENIYPDDLKYIVSTRSEKRHRAFYDISLYTADVSISGTFVLNEEILKAGEGSIILSMGDVKGIQGTPQLQFNGQELKAAPGDKSIHAVITLGKDAKAGDVIPFSATLKVNGSAGLYFRSTGKAMSVEMTSDETNPSFKGIYLPSHDIRPDGFTAKWDISSFSANGRTDRFGVSMITPVTQYQMTDRATKYGLLVIFLVFIAALIVEIASKRPIHIIQYLIIGGSLVLFYSLLLAFADFISFGWAYLIATVMTTAAVGGYFISIVKNKWGYVLTGLVAIVYLMIYVIMQMETYAFLTGTLLLFLVLCLLMYLTRNLKARVPQEPQDSQDASTGSAQ